ncbi:MAG: thiamine-phosphate kinase [Prevotella sp.]|nr:thiamine-phosphate kinase [Prevotella sp.]
MDISEIGEFGLIERLAKRLPKLHPGSVKGIGDDCAVLHYEDEEVLVTSDMLMEGVHFDLTYIDLKHLGYKAAMVNMSDIFAMNGTPRQLIVSLALDRRIGVEDVEEFYDGVAMACEKWGVDIVGGDTTSSLTGLAISITCVGGARKNDIVKRDGARDTDLVCVSGDLGAAYMGLQLLEREKSVYYQQVDEAKKKGDKRALDALRDFQPDFAGKEYLLERQLQPEARGDIIRLLKDNDIRPTAMIDISDGLSSELHHVCKQSRVGCRIYEKNIPIDYSTALAAEEFNMNVITCAANGGEDYELLFTVPIGDYDKVKDLEGVRVIGHICREELGLMLVARDGKELELRAQGWDPLGK